MKRRVLAVACLVGFCALTLTGLIIVGNQSRESERASKCSGCLSCIGNAMHDYHVKYGHFPPPYVADSDGNPAHSWRVLLLEFLDNSIFQAYRFDQPWNSAHNRSLESAIPSCYTCPSDHDGQPKWHTNYFVVVGGQTMFSSTNTMKINDVERPPAKTILVVESVGSGVHWMEPKDLEFDTAVLEPGQPKSKNISSRHRRGPLAIAVDCSVLQLKDLHPDEIREMLLIR